MTTTTRYLLGGLEELTTTGGTNTLTKYYAVPGVVTAIRVGTTLSYLATDGRAATQGDRAIRAVICLVC